MPAANQAEGSVSYLGALCRAVPYHVVERVLESPTADALSPQVFDGTVLFVDVVNFTARCEQLTTQAGATAGAISALLDSLYTAAQFEAFFPFGGYVVEFSGDAMTVVFRGENAAWRAAAAAVRTHQVVARVSAKSERDALRDLQVRVGIATGPITLAVVGDASRQLSVVGREAVHRAFAMERSAQPGTTMVCAATAAALNSVAQLTPSTEAEAGSRLNGLSTWPTEVAPQPLAERLPGRVDDKVRLLEPFVAAPLARRLRSLPTGWSFEQEVRRAVIVFAEVHGFEKLVSSAVSFASGLAHSLLRAFHRYDGVVLKCVAAESGHRIMVLFGSHRPADNDDEKAVLAALETVTRLRGFLWSAPVPLDVRIGINSGKVLFGAIGSRSKHDLTALGDAVNVAARAASCAKPFEVVATNEVMKGIADLFTSTELPPTPVKGKSAPLSLHLVHGPAGGRARYARRRTMQRFVVGRDSEKAQLGGQVGRALEGHSSFVMLVGDAGTGKSHLLSNAIDGWIEGGGTALVGRCRLAHRMVPLAPAREFFDAFLGLVASDDAITRAARINERLRAHGVPPDATELTTFLQPVRRPDGFDESVVDLSDSTTRERLLEQICVFLAQRLSETKLLYVLEDMHFADGLTLELVRRLVRLSEGKATLFIGTARPDDFLNATLSTAHVVLRLTNFDRTAATELLAHELRAKEAPAEMTDFLWRRTLGNPEHLVETIRFLSDRWLLAERDGVVTTSGVGLEALNDIVPTTRSRVALARLDGLNVAERRLLRVASAIGQSFSEPMLHDVDPEIAPDAVKVTIEDLLQQQLLSREAGDSRLCRFRDDEIRAAAYSVIPDEDRRQLHVRIAAALEKAASSGVARAAALAHHWEQAGELKKAAQWLETATAELERAGLMAEARSFNLHLASLRARPGS